jgi:hypothetical protein
MVTSFAGCAELINTEHKTVNVRIVDAYHRSAWAQPMMAGKVMTMITHPAVYRIDVEYEGVEYSVSGSDTYNAYKDLVGETVPAILEIRTYDDGTVKYDIISLGLG